MYLVNYLIDNPNTEHTDIIITIYDDSADNIKVYNSDSFIGDLEDLGDSIYKLIINTSKGYGILTFKSYLNGKLTGIYYLQTTQTPDENSKKIVLDLRDRHIVSLPTVYIPAPRYIKVNFVNRNSAAQKSKQPKEVSVGADINLNFYDSYDRGFIDGVTLGRVLR